MVNLTLSVPDDIKKKMEQFPEINWSEIARAAVIHRLKLLEKFKEFARHSELTEEDALIIGKKVNRGIAKRYSS
ncbi:MAG TPA: hypothetical protein VJK03_04920 [Candidatus Nanoarchaeia archaeon]|nr:hypothetical protein [Candidatus Nanoarchaeia archaeon]